MAILSEDEVREALATRRAWRRTGDTLVRERMLRDFGEALRFLELIGQAVDDWGRHPDIAIIGGNRVRVVVTNANGAGFTDAELRMVEKVDEIADAPLPPPAPPAAPAPRAPVAAAPAPAPQPVVEAVPDDEDDPQEESRSRGGRLARIAAGLGGLAVGAAAVLVARRR